MATQINFDRRSILRASALTLLSSLPGKMLSSVPLKLPTEGFLPTFRGATGWLNTESIQDATLHGKIVLVDFWTYSCINWRRTLPFLRAWNQNYKEHGLVVIGVHTPEFLFERDTDNVREATKSMRIEFPIALDNNFGICRAFANEYWPALYFVDAKGRIRHHQFGEGDYDRSEQVIQDLLMENGATGLTSIRTVDTAGPELAADWNNLKSPENYLGYARTVGFEAHRAVFDRPGKYEAPVQLKLNHWGLAGDWIVMSQEIASRSPHAKICYQFHARDLHLVMKPAIRGSSTRFRVSIDGNEPGSSHGVDIDARGIGTLDEPRMYQLIRQSQSVIDRRVEIEFLEPSVNAYSFTFG